MSNYLSEIESEFSRLRGKPSRLSSLDWNLADKWQQSGVPLRVVLSAMQTSVDKFRAQNRKDSINSLSYFKQEVEKQSAEYNAAQVGKTNLPIEAKPTEIKSNSASSEDFICLNCRFYENNSKDFYTGFCRFQKLKIFNARENCNPEIEMEMPENYQYYERAKV